MYRCRTNTTCQKNHTTVLWARIYPPELCPLCWENCHTVKKLKSSSGWVWAPGSSRTRSLNQVFSLSAPRILMWLNRAHIYSFFFRIMINIPRYLGTSELIWQGHRTGGGWSPVCVGTVVPLWYSLQSCSWIACFLLYPLIHISYVSYVTVKLC